jgi:nicotinate-nucleotide adenylyltransferase
MRIGIFGGTFDPLHFGHLVLASEAKHQLSLDRVLFILTPDPPHKLENNINPLEARLSMLQAAIEGNPGFILSRVEIDRNGPHYAVDTVRLLRHEYPEDELVYLMGGDSMKDLLVDWYQPIEFISACDTIGLMRRPQDKLDLKSIYEKVPELENKIQVVDAPLLDISSRRIRKNILEGKPYRYYLPETVLAVIEEQGLYKNT